MLGKIGLKFSVCLSKSVSLTLILTKSSRKRELTQRSKASTFTTIYWTLSFVTTDSIMKTWWGATFGGFFEKAICSKPTVADLENPLISEALWVVLTVFVYLPCKCCFFQVLFFIRLHERKDNNFLVLSLYTWIFLRCGHKIKVCAECSRFFRRLMTQAGEV